MAQPGAVDGRTARKVAAMRRVQTAALRLFERRGYDAVTVEDVAKAAKVGVASVYRNFGSKERVVLWDEYDPLLFDAVARALATAAPLVAIRDGLIAALGGVYRADRERILRRARLVRGTPALEAAVVSEMHQLRGGLAAVLEASIRDPFERALVSAVVSAALEVAVNQWVDTAGVRPLATMLRRAFRMLAKLG